MTTNTPNRNYPVPEPDDEFLDGADAIAALGFQVDQDWPFATGLVTSGEAGGWELLNLRWYRFGRLVFFQGTVTRSGSTVTLDAETGNVGGIAVATLPTAIPLPEDPSAFIGGIPNAGDLPGGWRFQKSNRTLYLVGVSRGASIPNGRSVSIYGSYLAVDL